MFMDFVKYLAERPLVRIDPDLIYQQLMNESMGIAASTESSF
jgi:hypothetical protein